MGVRGELYSSKFTCEGRTYFFNVKQNRMGDVFLTIVESKPTDGDMFDRRSIVVFGEQMDGFLKAFRNVLSFMDKTGNKVDVMPYGLDGESGTGDEEDSGRARRGGERSERTFERGRELGKGHQERTGGESRRSAPHGERDDRSGPRTFEKGRETRPGGGAFIPRDGSGRFAPRDGGGHSREGGFKPRSDRDSSSFKPREGSFRPREGSFRPREGSFKPREGSFKPREGSFKPREGSFRPREGSFTPRTGRDSAAPRQRDDKPARTFRVRSEKPSAFKPRPERGEVPAARGPKRIVVKRGKKSTGEGQGD